MADITKLKKLIGNLKNEAKTLKKGLTDVGKIGQSFGEDTFKKIKKGTEYIEDLPNIIGKQMLKLLDIILEVFSSVLGEGFAIIFKIVWIVLKKTYTILEKVIPYFWLIKFALLGFIILQVMPTLSIIINFLSLLTGRLLAVGSVYGVVISAVTYVIYNFEEVYKTITGWIGDIDFVGIIVSAVKELAPEIAKLFKKLSQKLVKVIT